MNKNHSDPSLSNIEDNIIYKYIEILLLVADFVLFFRANSVLDIIIILIVFVIIVIVFYLKYRRKNAVPSRIEFMVEFAESIGYTNRKRISDFSDKDCNVDYIKKKYYINGINVKMEKEYYGSISSETAEGLKIMTCGGSSTDIKRVNASAYCYHTDSKTYMTTRAHILQEYERCKVLMLMFTEILSRGDSFRIVYRENTWEGAMREEYDGIVVGEHLFYTSLNKQDITLCFLNNPKTLKGKVYEYNYITKTLKEKRDKVLRKGDELSCSITNASKKCIYFFMYEIISE